MIIFPAEHERRENAHGRRLLLEGDHSAVDAHGRVRQGDDSVSAHLEVKDEHAGHPCVFSDCEYQEESEEDSAEQRERYEPPVISAPEYTKRQRVT